MESRENRKNWEKVGSIRILEKTGKNPFSSLLTSLRTSCGAVVLSQGDTKRPSREKEKTWLR